MWVIESTVIINGPVMAKAVAVAAEELNPVILPRAALLWHRDTTHQITAQNKSKTEGTGRPGCYRDG